MEFDNPAQRLFEILEKAQSTKLDDRSTLDVWRELLSAGEPAVALERLGKVIALPQMILLAIEERHPGTSKHHRHWVSQIITTFAQQGLSSAWSNFRNKLTPELLSNVAIAATALDAPGARRKIDIDGLSGISETVETLARLVLESELQPDLKRYLVRQVRRMQTALDEYFITGGEPVVELVEATLGHLGTQEEGRKALRTPDGMRIIEVLALVADGVTVAGGLPPLLAAGGMHLVEWARTAISN